MQSDIILAIKAEVRISEPKKAVEEWCLLGCYAVWLL
jgi:hypothetical protein